MPRIEDYNTQVGAQGPVGGLDPRVEAAGAIGRAVSSLGAQVNSSEDLLYRRKEQQETSDTYAFISDQREQYNQKIQQGLQDGSLNVDKIKSDFQDTVNDYSQNISTGGGQNYLQRQAARLQGTITQKAITGQAQQDGIIAVQNLTRAMNSNANTLGNDPTQLQDVVDASREHTQSQVDAGTIKPGQAEKLNNAFEEEYAKSAILGFAQRDPKDAKARLDNGDFDQYFGMDPETKRKMYSEVNRVGFAKEIDNKRSDQAEEDERQAKAEAWKQDNASKIFGGQMSAQEVYNQKDLLSWADQKEVMGLIKAGSKEEYKSDPKVFNDLTRRLYLQDGDPQKITDMTQLAPFIGNGIAPHEAFSLTSQIAKTPEARAAQANRKAFFDYAKDQIVRKDSMTGMADPQGQASLARLMVDVQAKESDYRKQNLSPADLYNPTSKDSLYNTVFQYKRTPQQQLADISNTQRGVAPTLPSVNAQGVLLPQKNQPAQQTNTFARNPGESPQDFLARKKAGNK